MLFKQFKVEGLGCYSYLIGCPAAGTACVVDPERHVAQYVEAAEENGLDITAVFDTHLHADHISGSGELAARTGATVYVHPGVEAGYPHKPVHEGQRFRFGAAELEVIETFGHTPNSISLAVTDHARSSEPFALLTGDLLFVGGSDAWALHAATGAVAWTVDLGKGWSTQPLVVGKLVVLSGAPGMLFVDRESGRPLRVFDPGSSFASPPAARGDDIYALSNLGYLYALRTAVK